MSNMLVFKRKTLFPFGKIKVDHARYKGNPSGIRRSAKTLPKAFTGYIIPLFREIITCFLVWKTKRADATTGAAQLTEKMGTSEDFIPAR